MEAPQNHQGLADKISRAFSSRLLPAQSNQYGNPQPAPSEPSPTEEQDKGKELPEPEPSQPVTQADVRPVLLKAYQQAPKRFEFVKTAPLQEIDKIIRGAFLLSIDTPYELIKADGTYIGLSELLLPSEQMYFINYDRTTNRLIIDHAHRVFLREPPMRFDNFKRVKSRLRMNRVDPSIFDPVKPEDLAHMGPDADPFAVLSVQLLSYVQLQRIDNFGRTYYILEFTFKPTFGLTSSVGSSHDCRSAAWYMNNFTLSVENAYEAGDGQDLNGNGIPDHLEGLRPVLHEYQHFPYNEVGEIQITAERSTNYSVGADLTPAPPFASLSATVGFTNSRSATSKLANLNCTYMQVPGHAGVRVSVWQVELAHFIHRLKRKNKTSVPKLESFYSGNHTARSIGRIPQEAMRLLEKPFLQSYIFEEPHGRTNGRYELDFFVSACATAAYSAAPGNGKNFVTINETGESTITGKSSNCPRRVRAVQRTKLRVELVPSSMEIYVHEVPLTTRPVPQQSLQPGQPSQAPNLHPQNIQPPFVPQQSTAHPNLSHPHSQSAQPLLSQQSTAQPNLFHPSSQSAQPSEALNPPPQDIHPSLMPQQSSAHPNLFHPHSQSAQPSAAPNQNIQPLLSHPTPQSFQTPSHASHPHHTQSIQLPSNNPPPNNGPSSRIQNTPTRIPEIVITLPESPPNETTNGVNHFLPPSSSNTSSPQIPVYNVTLPYPAHEEHNPNHAQPSTSHQVQENYPQYNNTSSSPSLPVSLSVPSPFPAQSNSPNVEQTYVQNDNIHLSQPMRSLSSSEVPPFSSYLQNSHYQTLTSQPNPNEHMQSSSSPSPSSSSLQPVFAVASPFPPCEIAKISPILSQMHICCSSPAQC